jgi:hypothetical protein
MRITSAPPASPECSVPAHDLDDEDPVVRLGRRVQAVDRLGGDLDGGVEAEGEVGPAEVVVDRLGHPEDGDAVRVQPRGGAERVLAADGDEPVDVERAQRVPHPGDTVLALVGVRARGAQDRPAARQDASSRVDGELDVGLLEHAAPPVEEAEDHVPVAVRGLAHDGADHRVEAGAVSAAGEHSEAHRTAG